MKKFLILLTTLCLLPALVLAAEIDLSGMSFDELVALRDQINLAIWESAEWEEVTVPQGVWKVGVDIPAGHWTIKPADGAFCYIKYGDVLDASGQDIDYSPAKISIDIASPTSYGFDQNSDRTEADIDAKDGYYFVIEYGSVVFSPYAGKPDLGFSGLNK